MKNKARQIAMLGLAALAMGECFPHISGDRYEPTPTDPEAYKKLLLKKGVQEYEINGVKVLARDYKNAVRKANRITSESKEPKP